MTGACEECDCEPSLVRWHGGKVSNAAASDRDLREKGLRKTRMG